MTIKLLSNPHNHSDDFATRNKKTKNRIVASGYETQGMIGEYIYE